MPEKTKTAGEAATSARRETAKCLSGASLHIKSSMSSEEFSAHAGRCLIGTTLAMVTAFLWLAYASGWPHRDVEPVEPAVIVLEVRR